MYYSRQNSHASSQSAMRPLSKALTQQTGIRRSRRKAKAQPMAATQLCLRLNRNPLTMRSSTLTGAPHCSH